MCYRRTFEALQEVMNRPTKTTALIDFETQGSRNISYHSKPQKDYDQYEKLVTQGPHTELKELEEDKNVSHQLRNFHYIRGVTEPKEDTALK